MRKKGFLVLVCVILFCAIVNASLIVVFMNTYKWEYNVENFELKQRSFEAVARFCSEYVNEHVNSEWDVQQYWIMFWDDNLFYEGTQLTLDSQLQECLKNVDSAFQNKKAIFSGVFCYADMIYFYTNNGFYSVVYSPKSRPVFVYNFQETEKPYVKEIVEDWYHVIKKP